MASAAIKPARPGGLPYAELAIQDFSGGLNVRDAATELKENETPDCMNVVIDERGGVAKRLGYSRWNATALPNLLTYGYESDVCNCVFWYSQADGKLYRDTNGLPTLVKTFAAGAAIAIADFAGVCYLIHAFDGMYASTNGTSWSLTSAASGAIPSGDMLAVWQNKLWVASSTSNLLSFSAPGDPTRWDPADDAGANYIREGNDFPISCLFGTSGVDVQAKPALLVGKRSGAQGSTHRVTDASTGDYATIDQGVGPAGPRAITSLYGSLYMLSTAGIFQTDGQSALLPIGSRLSKMFDPAALDFSQAAGFAAGRTRDRVRFSIARADATGNDLALEYHPAFQAFTARSDAASCYVTRGQQNGILLGGSPNVVGRIWQFDSGGADDGEPISSRILTRVFQPGVGWLLRLQHVRILGRGHFTMESLADFAKSGKQKDVSLVSEGFTWDSDGWDDPTVGWGEDLVEGWGSFYPRHLGRAFQIRVSETSTAIGTAPPLLEDGAALTVGAWSLYGLQLHFSSLHPIV
jgi:hypothetical protein